MLSNYPTWPFLRGSESGGGSSSHRMILRSITQLGSFQADDAYARYPDPALSRSRLNVPCLANCPATRVVFGCLNRLQGVGCRRGPSTTNNVNVSRLTQLYLPSTYHSRRFSTAMALNNVLSALTLSNAALAFVVYWCAWIVYCKTWHPLARIPGPLWSAVSRTWIR